MRTLIIAEAGENHNGKMELAYELIDAAKDAGADIVKFQTSINSISKYAQKAEYQKKNTDVNENQLEMVNKLRLGFDNYRKLQSYCQKSGIEFLSTPFDAASVHFLADIGVRYWKIPSGDIFNIPYLEAMTKYKKPTLLSTGMSTFDDIDITMEFLKNRGIDDITMLQCTTEYPTPYENVNLNAMVEMQKRYGVKVGISDHSLGTEVPIAAVAMGAVVVEKHFTLDKNMEGPDHKASLEPSELKQMIRAIRNIEKAMGDGEKTIQDCERPNIAVARKSIVANCHISKGDIFTQENLITKRPGDGVSSLFWHDVIGKRAGRDYEEDELIDKEEGYI